MVEPTSTLPLVNWILQVVIHLPDFSAEACAVDMKLVSLKYLQVLLLLVKSKLTFGNA